VDIFVTFASSIDQSRDWSEKANLQVFAESCYPMLEFEYYLELFHANHSYVMRFINIKLDPRCVIGVITVPSAIKKLPRAE
jgi:hypothetical protein